jgi:hypothetical protein
VTDPDIEALLGGPEPPKRNKGGRPTREEAERRRLERNEPPPVVRPLSFEEIREGVPVSWLAALFRLEKDACRRRLQGCPSNRTVNGNTPLYDFLVAATYLVKPKFDEKLLRRSDLPPELQDQIWAAKLKRQRWEEKAGDLWRTSAVLSVLGKAFLHIKNTMQLWTEDVRLARTLGDDQRAALVDMVDGLQKDIHEKLVGMAAMDATQSQLAELEAEEAADVE